MATRKRIEVEVPAWTAADTAQWINEAAQRRPGRPPAGPEPKPNRVRSSEAKKRLERAGGRRFTVSLGPASAAACDRLKRMLGLTTDRAAVEVALLSTQHRHNAEALSKLMTKKGKP